jgi:hypothetical protein
VSISQWSIPRDRIHRSTITCHQVHVLAPAFDIKHHLPAPASWERRRRLKAAANGLARTKDRNALIIRGNHRVHITEAGVLAPLRTNVPEGNSVVPVVTWPPLWKTQPPGIARLLKNGCDWQLSIHAGLWARLNGCDPYGIDIQLDIAADTKFS